MEKQTGGCLCGDIRYQVSAPPLRVTFCHCRFCQRARGGPYAVEPIFNADDMTLTQGEPKTYDHVSTGSGKVIINHFCKRCGTGLYYTFERFPGFVGIHAGTFDDPNWFTCDAGNAKHIFLDAARQDTVLPPGLPCFRQHASDAAGRPIEPTIYDSPRPVSET